MKSREHLLSEVQWVMHDFDLARYKMVANWLNQHINLHEMNFSAINVSIEDIGLSIRACNVLKENDIKSLQELLILASNGHSIRVLKGAGKAVTKEIEEKVFKFQHTMLFKSKTIQIHSLH